MVAGDGMYLFYFLNFSWILKSQIILFLQVILFVCVFVLFTDGLRRCTYRRTRISWQGVLFILEAYLQPEILANTVIDL